MSAPAHTPAATAPRHRDTDALAPALGLDDPVSAETRRLQRRRSAWLGEVRSLAIGYGFHGLFLALFTALGTVPIGAALLFVVPGWLSCALSGVVIASGRSAGFRDPSLSVVRYFFGMGVCALGILLYPGMVFVYVLALFTAFLAATYGMTRRQGMLSWLCMAVAIGVATLPEGRTLQIPHASSAEQLLAWACFAITLARCVLLSVVNTRHNLSLRRRGEQMKETLAQIERLARFDELTQVHNRRHVLQTLADERARAVRENTPLAVALLDIDHFKQVNDSHGHGTGDRTLQQFAAAVKAAQRSTDRFGRYGGEEFLLVLPATGADEARQALERLRAAVAAVDWHAVSPGLKVTFSAGLVHHRAEETDEQLLNRADQALYAAKHAGRNRVHIG